MKVFNAQVAYAQLQNRLMYAQGPEFSQYSPLLYNMLLINGNPQSQNEQGPFFLLNIHHISSSHLIGQVPPEQAVQRNEPVRPQIKCKRPKKQRDGEYCIQKNRYTPRRTNLEQTFLCELQGCKKKYSSLIALRKHQRDIHNKRTKRFKAK